MDEKYLSKSGDVVIPTSGETPDEIATATCVMVDNVVLAGDLIILKNSILNGQILSYIINHKISRKISKIAQGKSVVHIQPKEIAKISICYPSDKEQNKLSLFFELINKKIQFQQQLIENLKLYKRGCFLYLHNHFDKSELLFKDIYLQASEGGTPPTNNHNNYDNGNIPFVKIDDLSSRYLYNTKHYITQQGLDNSSAWIVPSENIIFSNGATIGSCSINKIPVTTKQGILGIVLKETFDREYIYFYLTSSIFAKKIKKITTKGTMDCAYLKDINKIHISIPNIENQKNISRIVGKIEDIIEIEQSKMDKFIEMKNALINLMFI